MKTLSVGDLTVKSGEKTAGFFDVAEHLDGSPERLPLVLVNGAAEGPSLWITGCEHGDETLSTATIIEFVSRLDPRKVKGQVVAFPVLNTTAFNVKRRFSPIDSYDFSRAWPGFRNGWLAQQATAQLIGLLAEGADYVIDVHGGIPGILDVSPYCVATYEKKEQWDSLLKDFTESFLFEKIIHWIGTSTERGERKATMMASLLEKGIPCFVPEVGPDTRTGIEGGVRGFENTMKHLGMLDGQAAKLPSYRAFPDVIHIFPTRGGVFTSFVGLDEEVEAGQKLGSIRSFTGEITEELTTPAAGVVVVVWTNPVVGSGDFTAYEIATFEEFEQPWPGER